MDERAGRTKLARVGSIEADKERRPRVIVGGAERSAVVEDGKVGFGPLVWVDILDTLSTLVRLPEWGLRVRELMEPLLVMFVAKIVVGALGEFASHDPAEPALSWETKERDGGEAGEAVNSSAVIAPNKHQIFGHHR